MQRSRWTTLFALTLISGLGVGIQTPAAADSRLIEKSAAISYGDLDLDAAAGVERLYARLRNAAERVCDTRYRPGTLLLDPHARTCVTDALNRAVAEVDHRGLAAYHAARTEAGSRIGNRVAAVVERN